MIAIYARQSVDKKDSISIETQIDFAKRLYPEEECKIYIDKGFSGKNIRRPGFISLMQDVRSGLINKIVVYKLDRFSRSLMDFVSIWHELQKYGVEFLSVNEQFDTSTPMGKAMLFITEIFAELERETIAARCLDNYYQRTKTGRWPGGPAPYGYDLYKTLNQEDGKKMTVLIPNENMHYVQLIYEMYAEGNALGAVAKYLNVTGIPGVQRKTWNSVTIARLIRNPAYVIADINVYAYYKQIGVKIVNEVEEFNGTSAGLLVGKRESGTRKRKSDESKTFSLALWEGTIDSGTWIRCQKRLMTNRQIKNTGKGMNSWLSGMLKCGNCGRSIRIQMYKPTGHRSANCTGHIDQVCPEVVHLDLDAVEASVAYELEQLFSTCVDEMIITESHSDAKKELMMIEEKENNLVQTLALGATANLVSKVNLEIERLEKRKSEIDEELMEAIPSTKRTFKHLNMKELSIDEKKVIVKTYIDRIEVLGDDINIVWKI